MFKNMRQDKNQAIKLRKSGKSYGNIEKILGISKSTLSNWFQKENWSEEIKKRLSIVARKESSQRMKIMSQKKSRERQRVYLAMRQLAEKQFKKNSQENLFIWGLLIYWGEGDSKLENGIIRASNTDPIMLRLFYLFLKKYFPEIFYKTKAYLILYSDLVNEKCIDFWSKKIGLKKDYFIKSQYIQGHRPTKRLNYGICTLVITNRAYKEKILTWLKLFKREVLRLRV